VWDDCWLAQPDPLGRPPLKPFASIDELKAGMVRIFSSVDPVFASYYRTLCDEGLLDLEARSHKATAGYMSELPASKRAFIFTTAVGSHDDVLTQLHESGHAFHMFEAAHWPCHYQSMLEYSPIEFAELASGAMELLAAPYLGRDHGGFYTENELARAAAENLQMTLEFWPYMAVVDAFQHWVYEHPAAAHDTRQCDDVWASLHRRFLPHLDWSGVEDTLRRCWRLGIHIVLMPFYYVEYGMAQLGAVAVWANALQDQAGAVKAYRSALALGNTASLPDLYKAAGIRFGFGVAELTRAVELMERKLAEFEARQ
jgi:oligoendopeptidase F